MISALFIYNNQGKSLISRSYKDDENIYKAVEYFRINVITSRKHHSYRMPIIKVGSLSFLYIKQDKVWICAVTPLSANAAMVFEFLRQFSKVLKGYCGELDDEHIANNFVLIFELLDEMLDFGYPQTTDTKMLRKYIMGENMREQVKDTPKQITAEVTGSISWRPTGIIHKKQEVYLDVLEYIDYVQGPEEKCLSASIFGVIRMKALLSGMPECRLILADDSRIPINSRVDDDSSSLRSIRNMEAGYQRLASLYSYTFHQCVRLSMLEQQGAICFVPPDGEFELMRYRTECNIELPFRIITHVREIGVNTIEVWVCLKAKMGAEDFANKIEVKIPFPRRISSVKVEETTKGVAKAYLSERMIVWKMQRMSFKSEHSITVKMVHSEITNAMRRDKFNLPPVSVKFETGFVPSGMKVKNVTVMEPKMEYTHAMVTKWVRYIGRAGTIEARF